MIVTRSKDIENFIPTYGYPLRNLKDSIQLLGLSSSSDVGNCNIVRPVSTHFRLLDSHYYNYVISICIRHVVQLFTVQLNLITHFNSFYLNKRNQFNCYIMIIHYEKKNVINKIIENEELKLLWDLVTLRKSRFLGYY